MDTELTKIAREEDTQFSHLDTSRLLREEAKLIDKMFNMYMDMIYLYEAVRLFDYKA